MKRSNVFVGLAAAVFCFSLTACELKPQVMDGPGMINEPDQWTTTENDPVKDGNDGGQTDTDPVGNEVSTGNDNVVTVDDETLYLSFINDECKARFDQVIKDKNEEYTLSGLVEAQADESYSYYYYYDENEEYDYSAVEYYSFIDCGDDGNKELALWVALTLYPSEDFETTENYYYIIKNFDGELRCVADDEASYRTWLYINEYGVMVKSGSGGATLFCADTSFVNADGEYVFDYTQNSHMALAEPMVPIYEMPSYVREDPDCYEEEFAFENEFTTDVYNFCEAPDYPSGMTSDENGKFDAESQKKYDQYMKDLDDYYAKNIYSFYDVYGNYVEPSDKIKKFLDKNSIEYYSGTEIDQIISEHEAEIGMTDKIKNGEEVKWIGINIPTYTEDDYIGSYKDDMGDENLQIAKGDDGKYIIQIGVYRLCFMPDGVGEFIWDGRMDFSIPDENGNNLEGNITLDGKNATVTFTYSEWEYINPGDQYVYEKVSDTPNLYEYHYN